MANDEGRKNDSGKLPMHLLPVEAKRGLATILAHGALEYGAHNWRKGMDWTRFIAAAHRHLDSFTAGEDICPKSGLPHIDHLQACAAFLSTYQKLGLGNDDRYKAPPPEILGNGTPVNVTVRTRGYEAPPVDPFWNGPHNKGET